MFNGSCFSNFYIITPVIIIILISLVLSLVFLIKKKCQKPNNEDGVLTENNVINNRNRNFEHEMVVTGEINVEIDVVSKKISSKCQDPFIGKINNSENCCLCNDFLENNEWTAGIYKSSCGCIFCETHKTLIISESKNEKETKCPKCLKNKINFEPNTLLSCEICYESKSQLVLFHESCPLKVCLDCKEKCIKESLKCPNCRGDLNKKHKPKKVLRV